MRGYQTIALMALASTMLALQFLIYMETADHSRAESNLTKNLVGAVKAELATIQSEMRERAPQLVVTSSNSSNSSDQQRFQVDIQKILTTEIKRALDETRSDSFVRVAASTDAAVTEESGDVRAFLEASGALDQAISAGRWTFDDYSRVNALTPSLSLKQRSQLSEKFSTAINEQRFNLDELVGSGVPFAF